MTKVYLNHDGGVDDLVSLFLLLQMDQVDLVGVGVINADCYLEPALSASLKLAHRFGKGQSISIAGSNSRGKHPFPSDWRMHAYYIDALPILNETLPLEVAASPLPAHEDLIRLLKESDEKLSLIFIGPLTDLARALEEDGTIEDKIDKLYWMGGTFLEEGNVAEPNHDGSAEWNAYWDPWSVKRVFDSSIEIDMVALESTNQVPLTLDLRQSWSKERKFLGMDFLGQAYAMVPPLVHFQTNSTYFLWDVLTTMSFHKPNLVKKRQVKAKVVDQGPSQGKTYLDPQGRPLNLVDQVEGQAFFSAIENLAKKI